MVARAGLRDDIDEPHGAAAMWADGNLAFGEGIGAGISIWRKMADSEELTAQGESVVASAIGDEA